MRQKPFGYILKWMDVLTERLRNDGYYESVVLDNDGNRIEITE